MIRNIFLLCVISVLTGVNNLHAGSPSRFEALKQVGKQLAEVRRNKQHSRVYDMACPDEKKRVSREDVVSLYTQMDVKTETFGKQVESVKIVSDNDLLRENKLSSSKDFRKINRANLGIETETKIDVGGQLLLSRSVKIWWFDYIESKWCIKLNSL